MATETTDYAAVAQFINEARIRECCIDDPLLPELMRDHRDNAPHIRSGLGLAFRPDRAEGESVKDLQVFASGWNSLDGVMVLSPEDAFDADLRVAIAARNERALRDLLLSFPPGKTGFFYCAGEWTLSILSEILDGQVMFAREGYFAVPASFRHSQPQPVKHLSAGDYEVIQHWWSRDVWDWLVEKKHSVFASAPEGRLRALCFHWQVEDWRNEVHGLQAVENEGDEYAESVFSAATEEVLGLQRLATCTVNLSGSIDFLEMLRRTGYRLFYRIHSFLGVKRGSAPAPRVDQWTFFRGRQQPRPRTKVVGQDAALGVPASRRDPVVADFRALSTPEGRLERSQFLVEGLTLVGRAISDGLPVMQLLYTSALQNRPEGLELLSLAHRAGIPHFRVSDGLMGTVTTTRPLPVVIASVYAEYREATGLYVSPGSALLVADSIVNPNNLGLVVRTADAAGVEGVVIIGDGASPFDRECVRAARGAIGRIPIYQCAAPEDYLVLLGRRGLMLLGATSHAHHELYDCPFDMPIAFVVGNESDGIRPQILRHCTESVRIPMATGQSSLNVGVATGVLLYELVRRRQVGARKEHCE